MDRREDGPEAYSGRADIHHVSDAEPRGSAACGDRGAASTDIRYVTCARCREAVAKATGTSAINLVLDTNVMKEILSVHDLLRSGDTVATSVEALQSPVVAYRIGRAKYSILLAWVCAVRAYWTANLPDETLRRLLTDVPPEDKHSVETGATQIIIHFVVEQVLHGWQMVSYTEIPAGLVGDDADDALVALAARERVPLITNEGNSPRGLSDEKRRGKPNARGKAKAAEVAVFTPKEFLLKEGIAVEHEAHNFLRKFESERLRYEPGDGVPGEAEKMIDLLGRIYRLVLLDAINEDLQDLPRVPVP
jgi:hypothetical protein